jgi:heme exporter protein C
MKNNWWKILCVLLLMYSLIAGLLGEVPRRFILEETIRNLYFHVPMWFSMMGLLSYSVYASFRYLNGFQQRFDLIAVQSVNMGMVLGVLGLLTGSLWAKYTWGDWWTKDVKLNGALVTMMIYSAYLLLRNSIPDEQKKARVSAVYNIFAYVLMIVFLMILPRMFDSLHPGNGDNAKFIDYDLDNKMRPVFYAAVTGWFLFGLWVAQIRIRLAKLELEEASPEVDSSNHLITNK